MTDAAFSILNDVFFSLSPPPVSFTLHRLHKLPLSPLSALRWEGGRGEPFATSWDEKGERVEGEGRGGVIYYTKTHAAPFRRLQGDPFPAAILAPRVGRRGGRGFPCQSGCRITAERKRREEKRRRGRKGAFKKVDSRGGRRGRRGCSRARSFRLSLPPLFSPPPGRGKSIP